MIMCFFKIHRQKELKMKTLTTIISRIVKRALPNSLLFVGFVGLFPWTAQSALAKNSSAEAKDLNGRWLGWVDWTYDGSGTRCDSQMHFQQNETQLSRVQAQFDCQVVYMEAEPKTWLLKNGKMYQQDAQGNAVGEALGEYADKYFHWVENYDENVIIENEIRIEARHIDYKEKWTKISDQSTIYLLNGRLFLKE